MRATDVLAIVDHLTAAGVRVWLDGGWGVDALLGEQTREHDDLDVVITLMDAETARRTLSVQGFVVAEDELPTRFIIRDLDDRRVDFHTVTLREDGAAIQHLRDGTPWIYPVDGFSGTGQIAGRSVACLSAETQLLCHLGYEPDDTDQQDMRALARRFGMALPPPFTSPIDA